jgi:transcriptional regulator with PAS, ATPase and Fis domain
MVVSIPGWAVRDKMGSAMEVTDHLHDPDETKQGSWEEVIRQRLAAQTPSLVPQAASLALAASHDVTVLLTGETGTGKTYLARLIHECSPRRNRRFLAVPCGALSNNLVESELFGHVKGAFTSADQNKAGKFAAVGHGTLLLDEIDALGLEQQAKLLRVIETGEFEPVGGNQTQVCHARLIAASNWNLAEAVAQGRFRQDLYYRLDVMAFHLLPLCQRKQDIAPLVRYLVSQFNEKFHKTIRGIHAETMAILESYPWPGNIRQLENVIQLVVMTCNGPDLLPSHVPKIVQQFPEHHD